MTVQPAPWGITARSVGNAETGCRIGPKSDAGFRRNRLPASAEIRCRFQPNCALKGRGVALKATEQPIDTGSAAGKAFLDMLGVFAEFETNLRRERQMEGIAAAKARGVYKGRKPSIDAEAVRRLDAERVPRAEIARRLGIGRASVYRVLGGKGAAETVRKGLAQE